ncbi:MAG TPA: polysaccharide biosynthesis/export family protein [Steroidobacteraceae bacterium]|nr:polysaccharide biosynthesis/export family protein [Steroidobacteraceae bacterium]
MEWRSALGAFFCLLFVVGAQRAEAQVAKAGGATAAVPSPMVTTVGISPQYRLQPGDLLTISVWREKELDTEALVRPDGGLSFPLVGDVTAAGHTIEEVRATLVQRLRPFIPDPVVTVSIKLIGGNHVYVVGKVQRPGEFTFSRPLDVMQALSLAGGATPFASLNDIVILRRQNGGAEHVLHFHYGDVARGKSLEQNVILESGDTVVVP